MITFGKFVDRWRDRTREQFLAQVEAPHLLLVTDPKRQLGTARFRTEAVDPEDLVASPGAGLLLLRVSKRPGGNAFPMMITMGRAPNNDVVVPDVRVSSFHAYFRRGVGGWLVCDASSNGTALDGEVLEKQDERPIASGARLTLARVVELVFLEPEDLYARVQEEG